MEEVQDDTEEEDNRIMDNFVRQTDLMMFKEELESVGADLYRPIKMSTEAHIELHKLYMEGRSLMNFNIQVRSDIPALPKFQPGPPY